MFLQVATKRKIHDILNAIQVIVVIVGNSREKTTKTTSTFVVQVSELTTPKNKLGWSSSWFYELCK
jgi:hypothetical protein